MLQSLLLAITVICQSQTLQSVDVTSILEPTPSNAPSSTKAPVISTATPTTVPKPSITSRTLVPTTSVSPPVQVRPPTVQPSQALPNSVVPPSSNQNQRTTASRPVENLQPNSVVRNTPVQPVQPQVVASPAVANIAVAPPVSPSTSSTEVQIPHVKPNDSSVVNGQSQPIPNSSQATTQPASNSSTLYIIAGVMGVCVVAVGGFITARRILTRQGESKDLESVTTKPKDLSLERFSAVPALSPLRHSTLDSPKSPKEVMESLHRPVVGLQSLEPKSPVSPSVASRNIFDSQFRDSMYSDIRPVSVPAPVQRESIAYSEATSGFEQEIFQSFDELMIDSSTERYASLPFQSSLIHMMNSDDAAFGLAASASAHASQDSHSDKYDSMLFSDDGSEYSQ